MTANDLRAQAPTLGLGELQMKQNEKARVTRVPDGLLGGAFLQQPHGKGERDAGSERANHLHSTFDAGQVSYCGADRHPERARTSRRLTVVYMRLALPAQMFRVNRSESIWIFRMVEGRMVVSTGSHLKTWKMRKQNT